LSDPELTGVHARRRLSIALLAMMPLFVIYEASRAAVAAEGHNWRTTAEVLFSEPIELLGGGAEWRWLLLAIVAVAALVRAWKLGVNWGEGVLWSMLEGGAIGILLGPLMMLLLGGVFGWLPEAQLGASAASVAPPISRAGLKLSGAVWEELLFRFVVLAAVYQLGRWLFSFLDREDNERSRWPAEVLAIAVSSLAFAASHLEVVVGWLGYGGETYEFTLFAWRAFAGLLLAAIARSRGLGVAAWAHAMFNLGLILGSGPGVFLGQPG
jgi:hypothetical protein